MSNGCDLGTQNDDDHVVAVDNIMMEQSMRVYVWLTSDNNNAMERGYLWQDNMITGKVIMLFVAGAQRRVAGTVAEVESGPGSVLLHFKTKMLRMIQV